MNNNFNSFCFIGRWESDWNLCSNWDWDR